MYMCVKCMYMCVKCIDFDYVFTISWLEFGTVLTLCTIFCLIFIVLIKLKKK
jgi:hypothetical protein